MTISRAAGAMRSNGDRLSRAIFRMLQRWQRRCTQYRPDVVAHFAAYAYVGKSVERPELYYRNNSFGTLVLLEEMLKAGDRQADLFEHLRILWRSYAFADRRRRIRSRPSIPTGGRNSS